MPVPHQPPNNIPLASSLPKVSFRKIPQHEAQQLAVPAGVQDHAHVSFGFNDGSEFDKPEHYLRHVEPIESELNKQVEYDMDEQDQEWLDALNLERRRDQLDAISYEVFEIIVDRLEKEWFDLIKRIPPKAMPVPLGSDGAPLSDAGEDIACAICDDGECENSNAIVFCDGCNLAVHQDCYGIPYIPEGQWLCRKCTVSPDRAVSCILCPHEGGAFKQTTHGKWGHLLCAMWIPETGVSNPVYMEPIDSIERIPKARWKLQCYLCNRRMGACIQCDNRSCFTAFHVTCARRAGLLLKSQRQRVVHSPEADGNESNEVLRAWCHKHLPRSLRAQRAKDEEFLDAHSQPPSPTMGTYDKKKIAPSTASPGKKKSARAYKKSYRAGPSLVPAYVVDRVLEYTSRIPVRKKQQLIHQIAKFWSLKREARRGAPLLKRLHLEPWTATASKEQSDAERLQKLQFLLQLREDLEKVRMLAEITRKREKEKQRQLQVIRSTLVSGILFPFHGVMRGLLERVMALDRSSVFLNPVSPQKVPDYYDIIKHPMDWSTIMCKVDEFQYTSVEDFTSDIHLVLENAMIYNKIETHYHRTAARILKVAEPIFVELDRLNQAHGPATHLQLEPEQQIADLLVDYADDEEETKESPAKNAIEDLTQHYYWVEAKPNTNSKSTVAAMSAKQAAAARKAADKAARSERGRLAYQTRLDNQRRAAETGNQSINGVHSVARAQSDDRAEVANRTFQSGAQRSQRVRSISSSSSSDLSEAPPNGAADTSEPSEVKNVGNWDSFKLFNVGWVLPEGMKRSRSRPDMAAAPLSEAAQLDDSLEGGKASAKRKHSVSSSATSMERKRSRSESTAQAEEATRRNGGSSIRKVGRPRKQKPTKSPPTTNDGDQLIEASTLCWAKLKGYPFFPAEVLDPEDEVVPQNVLELRPDVDQSSVTSGQGDVADSSGGSAEEQHYLVRFFDAQRTFGWIARSKIRLLFEDEVLDQQMLKAPPDARHRRDVRQALERARALAE